MRKSTIFISAVLTTFALVMLYRVAAAYTSNKVATPVAAAAATSLPEPTATDPPADVQANAALTPEQAAQVAAKVVGNTNLLSAESSSYNGLNAYLVTFTNNDAVYVGLDGQILSVQIAPVTPVVVNVAPPVQVNNKHGGSGGSHSSSGGEHEEHDD